MCDRIIMVHKGNVIAEGTAEALMEQTGTDNLRDVFLSIMRGEADRDEE